MQKNTQILIGLRDTGRGKLEVQLRSGAAQRPRTVCVTFVRGDSGSQKKATINGGSFTAEELTAVRPRIAAHLRVDEVIINNKVRQEQTAGTGKPAQAPKSPQTVKAPPPKPPGTAVAKESAPAPVVSAEPAYTPPAWACGPPGICAVPRIDSQAGFFVAVGDERPNEVPGDPEDLTPLGRALLEFCSLNQVGTVMILRPGS